MICLSKIYDDHKVSTVACNSGREEFHTKIRKLFISTAFNLKLIVDLIYSLNMPWNVSSEV